MPSASTANSDAAAYLHNATTSALKYIRISTNSALNNIEPAAKTQLLFATSSRIIKQVSLIDFLVPYTEVDESMQRVDEICLYFQNANYLERILLCQVLNAKYSYLCKLLCQF